MKIKGIIFDCDGTLVDSEMAANRALIALLHKYGLGQYTLEHAYEFFVGRTVYDIFQELEAAHSMTFPPDIIDKLIEMRMKEDQLYLKPIPGLTEALPRLASWFPMAVASNGERENVIRSLKLANIYGHFKPELIFTKDDVKHPKPAPDVYKHAAKALKIDPAEIVVIEDTPLGVQAGVAAGCQVWGFCAVSKHSPEPAQTLWDAGADQVFDTMRELAEALLGDAPPEASRLA